jgi:hypothetical protein
MAEPRRNRITGSGMDVDYRGRKSVHLSSQETVHTNSDLSFKFTSVCYGRYEGRPASLAVINFELDSSHSRRHPSGIRILFHHRPLISSENRRQEILLKFAPDKDYRWYDSNRISKYNARKTSDSMDTAKNDTGAFASSDRVHNKGEEAPYLELHSHRSSKDGFSFNAVYWILRNWNFNISQNLNVALLFETGNPMEIEVEGDSYSYSDGAGAGAGDGDGAGFNAQSFFRSKWSRSHIISFDSEIGGKPPTRDFEQLTDDDWNNMIEVKPESRVSKMAIFCKQTCSRFNLLRRLERHIGEFVLSFLVLLKIR